MYEFMWSLHGLKTFFIIKSVGNETERYHTIKLMFLTECLIRQHGCQGNESVTNQTLNFISVPWITLYYIHGSIFLLGM